MVLGDEESSWEKKSMVLDKKTRVLVDGTESSMVSF